MPFFMLIEVGWAFMMTWIFYRTGGSSLIAGYVFHSSFNYWTVVLLVNASVAEGQLEFSRSFDGALLRIYAVLVAVTALVFILASRGQLGRQHDTNA